ncbi:hypothetical protein [Caulobacter endophyticus]|uniref:Uncharacterized protein n=1 Tax=Caulobacter endophyticus TaxID=2172652 RepID=A0A2T9JI51_9CAUL|nr:hypothetical protein [Caulobacter endophyticus]PVM83375.1 hypothetical protein DDF67_20760 [Caulobacter endophyticus]
MTRPPKPARIGHGELTIARQIHPVSFSIHVLASHRGLRGAKGGITGEPDAMREAFRQGRVRLALDDGKALDVSIVAHAEGSATAYFEAAIDER